MVIHTKYPCVLWVKLTAEKHKLCFKMNSGTIWVVRKRSHLRHEIEEVGFQLMNRWKHFFWVKTAENQSHRERIWDGSVAYSPTWTNQRPECEKRTLAGGRNAWGVELDQVSLSDGRTNTFVLIISSPTWPALSAGLDGEMFLFYCK